MILVSLAHAADTLWYTGNGGDTYASVTGIEGAVGALESRDTWPVDLGPYRLIFLASPMEDFDTASTDAMRSWVAEGGVLVLVGEIPGFADPRALNTLADTLGMGAALGDSTLDCVDTFHATAGPSTLAVGSPGYSCSNDISGDTSEVIYTGYGGQTLAVEEAGVVLLADSNLVVDDTPFGADNSLFIEALLTASCAGLGDRDGDGADAVACGGTDCDDGDPEVYAGATERCDNVDEDCDGTIDNDATDAARWYADADRDGYGDAATAVDACNAPVGYLASAGDCDDTSADTRPGAPEHCDGADEDCDGTADNAPVDSLLYYVDADGDGFGAAGAPVSACAAPAGYAGSADDCDDTRADVNPAAAEVCDDADQDCDGAVDELAVDAITWSSDYDHDGYGGGDFLVSQCTQPDGYADNTADCDDHDETVAPGADELCDGIDNDCDAQTDEDAVDATTWYADTDDDGWGDETLATVACTRPTDTTSQSGDCDDADRTIHPEAPEECDGLDQDCDGAADNGLAELTWYTDADGDGLGDDATEASGCAQPAGTVTEGGDCDDADATRTTDCAAADTAPEKDTPQAEAGCGCTTASPADGRWRSGLGALLLLGAARRRRQEPEQ